MNRIWQLQDAKNKFSQVVDEALKQGPQIITKHGIETAVVVSYEEYRKMVTSQKKLSTFFQESPLSGVDLDLERDRSGLRENVQI